MVQLIKSLNHVHMSHVIKTIMHATKISNNELPSDFALFCTIFPRMSDDVFSIRLINPFQRLRMDQNNDYL